jgi:Leucine-rich repeat (LRR) protein
MKDADLQSLQGLSSLEELDLVGNPISDPGMEHLQGLKSLRILYRNFTRVTLPGEAKLKLAIPGLQVR